MSAYHRMMQVFNGGFDHGMVVWTKFQIPPGQELDTDEWAAYFQPLIHAEGHKESVWAKAPEEGNPNIVLLATAWYTTAALREFAASPSAQLFREDLASRGITPLLRFETLRWGGNWFDALSRSEYTQLHWIYFAAPLTDGEYARISDIRGMEPPGSGSGVPHHRNLQVARDEKLWATQTDGQHGQETQLVLWAHFWGDEEKAEWRFDAQRTTINRDGLTQEEGFIKRFEEAEPILWKEGIYDFKTLPRF
ncbi:hypothetical protein BJX99DRAFT_235397 [Aspergillus californicus]